MKNKIKTFFSIAMILISLSFSLNLNPVLAQPATPPSGSGIFENPITAGDVPTLLNRILSELQKVVVTLAILMIVIGGIMYMASFGNDAAMKRAKTIITAAVIGLAIVLAARTFLQEIWNILGVGSTVPSPGGDSFLNIATRALNLALSIVGVIGIIGIVVGGIMYLTSYGDDERIKTGKKIITASIIGLAVCLGAVIIVKEVVGLF